MNLSAYKKEIMSALLGALFGGLASLVGGLYAGLHNVTKTFELQIKKDTITRVKLDLVNLKQVSRDINDNVALVGNPGTTIRPSLQFKPKLFPSLGEILERKKNEFTAKETKETFRMMKAFAEMQDEQVWKDDWFEITHAEIPTRELITSAWSPGYGISPEIDFDLATKLDNLYSRMTRINNSIREMRSIIRGRFMSQRDRTYVEELINNCKTDSAELSRELVTVKDAVTKEISRLEELRERLST